MIYTKVYKSIPLKNGDQLLFVEEVLDELPLCLYAEGLGEITPGNWSMKLGANAFDVSVAKTHEELIRKKEFAAGLGEEALIPTGTIPRDDEEVFSPTPEIQFTGSIDKAMMIDEGDEEGDYYVAHVKTYCIDFNLFLKSKEVIEPGLYVAGNAGLFVIEAERRS